MSACRLQDLLPCTADMVVKDEKGDEMRVTILIIVCHAGKWFVRLAI